MKRLLLIGGGHAHLEVLRSVILRPMVGSELVLVSPHASQHYSSMLAGFLQGTYDEPEFAFDLMALCRRAGARFVEASADHISAAERTVDAGGEQISFDAVSIDIGSDSLGRDTPGAAEHAHSIRPMTRARALKRAAVALDAHPSVCIVGGGAAGVEIALAIHRIGNRATSKPDITVLERAATILSEFDDKARRRVVHVLMNLGVRIRTDALVTRVSNDSVLLESGETLRSDLTVWLTGAAGPALLARSDLPKNRDGFLLVDRTLRAIDGSPAWGAGDCVTLRDFPRTPKSGVYAVREAPVLAYNLRAALGGGRPRSYTPQSHSLALLNTADGKALMRWRLVASHSRAALWLKNHIDRAFMRRYQRLTRD
ncbi:MAG: FAD-dependent oxidoreductase [Anaerolineae bacterium]|nr:FAD-dependent oxidoreductase [Gemmatimonadaceae bacterium]